MCSADKRKKQSSADWMFIKHLQLTWQLSELLHCTIATVASSCNHPNWGALQLSCAHFLLSAQRRMGRKLPYKLQSGRPFTHFYSFFWLWSTGLYSCLTTWVTHFPKLSNPPNRSFLPILLCLCLKVAFHLQTSALTSFCRQLLHCLWRAFQ